MAKFDTSKSGWFEDFMRLSEEKRTKILEEYRYGGKKKDDEIAAFVGVVFGDGTEAAIAKVFGQKIALGEDNGGLVYELAKYYAAAHPIDMKQSDWIKRLADSEESIAKHLLIGLIDPKKHSLKEAMQVARELFTTEEGKQVVLRLRDHCEDEIFALSGAYAEQHSTPREDLLEMIHLFLEGGGADFLENAKRPMAALLCRNPTDAECALAKQKFPDGFENLFTAEWLPFLQDE